MAAAVIAGGATGPTLWPRCCLVRFEDAVADLDGAACNLLSFLDLNDSRYPFERIAGLPIRASSRASCRNGEVRWASVTKPEGFDPSKRLIDWSAKRRSVFDAVAGDLQKKAGYA